MLLRQNEGHTGVKLEQRDRLDSPVMIVAGDRGPSPREQLPQGLQPTNSRKRSCISTSCIRFPLDLGQDTPVAGPPCERVM
jgi:hypothetical protein